MHNEDSSTTFNLTFTEFSEGPGIAIDITDHFAFVTTYGFLGYRDDYRGSSVSGLNFGTEDLNVGFYFKF